MKYKMKEKAAKSKKTYIIISCLAAVIVILGIWIYHDNVTVGTTRVTVEDESLPTSFDGFTIAQISDFHNVGSGDFQDQLISAIESAHPDIIAVTGDLIDSRRTDIDAAMRLIERAAAVAPVYYVTGNHESRMPSELAELSERMESAGVRILRDSVRQIERGEDSVSIAGLDDPDFTVKGEPESVVDAAMRQRLSSLADGEEYDILLCHRPELFEVYCDSRVNLALTGHAHGGQFRIPLLGGLYTPSQGLFPDHVEGVFESDGTTMIVSRGLGNSGFPFRINNPPELIVATLKRKQG